MAAEPLISVIIPTYNRREFLAEALESVLGQSHSNLEILVIDDASTDGTGDYVKGLGSERIIYVPIEHRGFPGAVRNVGLRKASGEYVAFLDSDDMWMPEKLEIQLEVLENNDALDFVANNYFYLPPRRRKTALRLSDPTLVNFEDLLWSCPIQTSSVLIRRKAVEDVGLQDETLSTCQDYEYWLRVLRRRDHSGVILPQPLSVYRRHEGNHSEQDVVQCDRLSAIVGRHRDYNEELITSVQEELGSRKVFRQGLLDLQGGEPVFKVLFRRDMRMSHRLRLIQRQLYRVLRRH